MSNKSERLDRLDHACADLYKEFGDKFRVHDLAVRARVSNSVAGPHKRYWLYRRTQDSLVDDLRARPGAPPKSDVVALCDVASRANANVSTLLDTVNRLIEIIIEGKAEPRSKKSRTSAVSESLNSDAPSNVSRHPPSPSCKNFAGAPDIVSESGREVAPSNSGIQRTVYSDTGQDLEGVHTESHKVTFAPSDNTSSPTILEKRLAPLSNHSDVAAKLESERVLPVLHQTGDVDFPGADDPLHHSLDASHDSEVEGAPAGALLSPQSDLVDAVDKPTVEIGLGLTENEVIVPNFTNSCGVEKRSVNPIDAATQPAGTSVDKDFDVNSFAFVEEAAESVLLGARRALSGTEIHGKLPPTVRGRYSERYFSSLLRNSRQLYHNRSDGKFYVKLRGDGVSPSESVPVHLAATSAAASILSDAKGSLSSDAIYARFSEDLRARISEAALPGMLVSGALEDPVIEISEFGEWHLVGSAGLSKRRRNTRGLLPEFGAQVKSILRTDNHPMTGVEIHDLLSSELKHYFPRDKMYRHLQKLEGVFQYEGEDGPFLAKKWWLTVQRRVKHKAPPIDSGKSDRAVAMAGQDLITNEAERVVVANRPEEMSVDRILAEVRKKFDVDDATKFARALNSRRKAARARIVRVAPGVYRARSSDEN
jgi:hypothetical protein